MWTASALCALALISMGASAAVLAAGGDGDGKKVPDELLGKQSAVHLTQDEGVYKVADLGGRICVYYMDQVMFVTDIATGNLRKVDRELLSRGIETTSYEDVLKLLEDMGS